MRAQVAAIPEVVRKAESAGDGPARRVHAAVCTSQQIRGDAPDVRDDVHALGVVWYQLLTSDLGTGVPTGLWSEELADAGLSRELIRLLGTCVDTRADKRPADAARLAEQLAKLLEVAPASDLLMDHTR